MGVGVLKAFVFSRHSEVRMQNRREPHTSPIAQGRQTGPRGAWLACGSRGHGAFDSRWTPGLPHPTLSHTGPRPFKGRALSRAAFFL